MFIKNKQKDININSANYHIASENSLCTSEGIRKEQNANNTTIQLTESEMTTSRSENYTQNEISSPNYN